MCEIKVIFFYYVNICKHEHEKIWQGYDVKSCLRLVLNKLKEMKGPWWKWNLIPTKYFILLNIFAFHMHTFTIPTLNFNEFNIAIH
jgi:hypothetical protein